MKKNKKQFFISFGILILTIIITGIVKFKNKNIGIPLIENTEKKVVHANIEASDEMRGIWITFMTLDMKDTDKSENAFHQKFDKIVDKAKSMGLNTLIVQVRPFSDALYPSKVYPWSHLLTGIQGKDPGYDPLEYMIKKTHDSGLKFHAWINPFRIQLNNTPNELSLSNDYNILKSDKDKIISINNDKYYNPAYPENRAKIISGIKEILENYSIDGIQFDDYFYPKSDLDYDKISYDEYCDMARKSGEPLSLLDFRTANVDSLVSGTYSAIKGISKDVKFGISPQGNIQNDLKMGANVYKWGSTKGFLDYICPQIYVSFNHPVLPFDKTAKEWRNLVKCSDINLYFGLAMYKIGTDVDQGSWKGSDDILKREIEYGRELKTNGFMLYSWDQINKQETEIEVANVIKILK